MAYEVLMHSAPYASNVVVFMKALPDGAVYFKTPDGSRQYILNLPSSSTRAHGGDVAMALRAMLINKNLKTTPAELNKAASAVISKNTVRHGYSFVYDDDDEESDYLEGHLQHHGILGMKWGVRRYQNADGSLTDEGRKHYGSSGTYDTSTKLKTKQAIAKYGHESYQMQKEAKKNLKKAAKFADSHDPDADMKKDQYERKADEYNRLQKESRDKQKALRSKLADERVAKYGKNPAVAGELVKSGLRAYGLSAALTIPVTALASVAFGPGAGFLTSAMLSIPVSALTIQSNYVGMRNIVDIADSDKIPKEDKYKK